MTGEHHCARRTGKNRVVWGRRRVQGCKTAASTASLLSPESSVDCVAMSKEHLQPQSATIGWETDPGSSRTRWLRHYPGTCSIAATLKPSRCCCPAFANTTSLSHPSLSYAPNNTAAPQQPPRPDASLLWTSLPINIHLHISCTCEPCTPANLRLTQSAFTTDAFAPTTSPDDYMLFFSPLTAPNPTSKSPDDAK